MKFTSEDLMKAMGLKVGDRVKVNMETNTATFEVRDDFTLLRLDYKFITNARKSYSLLNLLETNYEILPQPKRVGDLKCDGKCSCCPIRVVCNVLAHSDMDCTLYERLEKYTDVFKFYLDKEIYDLLKARLDKEVEVLEDDQNN